MKNLTTDQEAEVVAAFGRLGSKRATARETGFGFAAVSRIVDQRSQPAGIDYDLIASKVARLMQGPPNEGPPLAPTLPLQRPARNGVTIAPRRFARILWLSDLHVPYHDLAAVSAALDFAREWRPELVILGGDLFDCYSVSRYEKSPEQLNDNLQAEFDAAKPIIGQVKDLGSEVVFLLGNHEARLDALIGSNPGLAGLRALGWHRVAELPPEWTVIPNQGRYRVGPLDFLHGDLKGRGTGARHIGAWMLQKIKRSTIFGHYHRPQVFPEPGSRPGTFATWRKRPLTVPSMTGVPGLQVWIWTPRPACLK